MAQYDSDSSGGEDGDYTETNVLLGYASKEASDDTISYLGGRPTWLDPTTPPSAALAKCKVCNDLMVLILQLNGDLPEHFPGHERRLYVLTCRRKTCRRKEGSVRVLRGVRITETVNKKKEIKPAEPRAEKQSTKPAVDLGAALFGGNPFSNSNTNSANPFSTNSASGPSNPFSPPSSSLNNPFAAPGSVNTPKPAEKPAPPTSPVADLPKTFASALSLNIDTLKFGPLPPPEPWPQESELPAAYPLYYLADADYETLDKIEDLPLPTQTMEIDEGSGSGNQKEDKDVYESTIDKTFQRFADRLSQNPEQVIRYEFKGQPLLYSKHDAVGKLLSGSGKGNEKVTTASVNGNHIPRCGNCGAGRAFEVQLTPHAIMELEKDEMSLDGMEWGTILVGVCEKDCQQKGVYNGVGFVEEWAGVQWEELNDRR
ncbi:related to rat apoptosis protein RP-8 [Rhynchosporium secalis]|uniref:Related to rat apoptosis protein RP-8 n=1 Tax=Rhynchosporium secalis TaxID=38038 RepID=A0A1E1M035_RHYSE|nr:related to rat apoptosis protein RP-8 [Rhynchosporium secalis]